MQRYSSVEGLVTYSTQVRQLSPKGIIGCEHNAARRFEYCFEKAKAQCGDHIKLVCPHGCDVVTVHI